MKCSHFISITISIIIVYSCKAQVNQPDINSVKLDKTSFFNLKDINQIITRNSMFELNDFTIDCKHELVYYEFTNSAHAHGSLIIVRYDSIALEIYKEQLVSPTSELRNKIIRFDSSTNIYKQLVGYSISTNKFYLQTNSNSRGISSSKEQTNTLATYFFLVRECNEPIMSLAAYGPVIYNNTDINYPDDTVRDLIRLIKIKISQAYMMGD